MPVSKWNMNINWDDLRGQRLDYIIRSIYNATIERDYWYRVMSVDQLDPKTFVGTEMQNNEILNKNSHRELQVIYEIFERWLRPYTKIKTDYDGQFFDMYKYCIFPDETQTAPDVPVSVNDFGFNKIYGVGNYDYTAGGNLSNLVGYDLSFIETGYTYGTINGDHLRAFYNILNLNLKNRCFSLVWDGRGRFGRPKYFGSSIPRTGLFYSQLKRYKIISRSDDNYSQLVSDFNAEPYDENPLIGSVLIEDDYNFRNNNIVESNQLISEYFASYIDPLEFKGFNIVDFDTELIINIEETRTNDNTVNFTYTTDTPIAKRVQNNNTVINGFNGAYMIDPLDEIQVQSVGPVPFGEPNSNIKRLGLPQLFIDLNKEGFLKYYTE